MMPTVAHGNYVNSRSLCKRQIHIIIYPFTSFTPQHFSLCRARIP